MAQTVELQGHLVGTGQPVYIIAEIGINHNGNIETAKRLIDMAKESGCDAVKFQKRTPEECIPENMRNRMRETPWGYISYLEYRHKVEFGLDEYRVIDAYCRQRGITWFASCWDKDSVDFIEQFDPPCIKVPSAMITSRALLETICTTRRPVILSTGMSSMDQVREAVNLLKMERLLLAHSTSTYPCPKHELNLRMLATLQNEFDCPIGYSGHEVGLATTIAAVALGACFIERHITLSRSMWGSDHAASVEPTGLMRLVKDVRSVEMAMGDGIKCVYESELSALQRLRIVDDLIDSRTL